MSSVPMMKFYPGDWLQGTEFLSDQAKAMYIDLICLCWLHEGLPQDDAKLAKSCGKTVKKFAKIYKEIEENFVVFPKKNGKIWEKRVLKEMQQLAEIQQKRRESGRKGGLANARNLLEQKDKQKPSIPEPEPELYKEIRTEPIPSSISISHTEHKHCAIQSLTENSSLDQKKKKQKRTVNGSGLKRFEEFWQTWPVGMKKARGKCERMWKSKNLDSMADQIIGALQAQVEARKDPVGFIPRLKDPEGWIDGRCWTDDLPIPEIDPGEAFEQEMASRRQQVREIALKSRENS